MTVRELCEVMEPHTEINLVVGTDPIPFDRNNTISVDALGDYLIGSISMYPATKDDPTSMVEVELKMTPLKFGRS